MNKYCADVRHKEFFFLIKLCKCGLHFVKGSEWSDTENILEKINDLRPNEVYNKIW